MLTMFNNTRFPRLKSFVSTTFTYSAYLAFTCWVTHQITSDMEDHHKREIIWDHFLDPEGCRQALHTYEKKQNRPR